MKRQGNLYQKVCDIDNIKKAIVMASKHKTQRCSVKRVVENIDYFALEIQNMLINKSYEPTPCKEKIIICASTKKEREIKIPKFYPDLCIQWALMLQLQPIIMRGMYPFCCGSVPGRGIHYSAFYVRKWLNKDKKYTKYCAKLDIHHFYKSINLGVLKNMFRKRIKDRNMLWLIDTIIDILDVGLPIGYFTSPWFANFLLQELDHLIKEKFEGVKHYIRYVDDMVLFGNNKKKLHKVIKSISEYLKSIGLEIKGNWQVFRVDDRGVDFLGYRFFRNYTILRKRMALRIKRRVKKAFSKPQLQFKDAAAIVSYLGWTKHCNSYNFYIKNIKPYIDMDKIKEVIRNESRKWNKSNHLQYSTC